GAAARTRPLRPRPLRPRSGEAGDSGPQTREAARTPHVGGVRAAVSRSRTGSELRPGLREDAADDLLHLVEFALAHRQRRRELDDRVTAIIGTAVQAAFVHLRRHEVLEDPLGLLLGERLLGVLVLDEFDSVVESLTTYVTDDRQVLEHLERVLERLCVLMEGVAELLGLEDVEVRHRSGAGDRVSAEGVAVVERLVAAGSEGLEEAIGGDHRTEGRIPG